ncbi:MAG TPA: hypothetical protein VMW95_09210 [Desulfobacterales bacterium]|nr:hypothetical protein [Desulfobacterales bacterium]
MEQIQISAKNLGAIALDDFCPRCFWIKLHTKKLPWQIFPGIFSSIDAYTKKVAHAWIDNPGKRPKFIDDLGVTGWRKPLWHNKSKIDIPEFGITLTGVADDIWLLGEKGIHIPDAKTARYTDAQDKLIPMYKVQLNGYAKIYSGLGENVTGLSMIYMEPLTDELAAIGGAYPDFFKMQFDPKFVPVEVDIESLDPLFAKTREIFDGPIPTQRNGCKDCEALSEIEGLIK